MHNFLVGSSFFEKGKNGTDFRRSFAHLWYANTMVVSPSRTVIICEGGSQPPTYSGIEYIHLWGDLGHCHDLINNIKPYEFSGWSASMAALAMLAYTNESDFIYKEEDCLAFGPWVEQMYSDMGSGDMVFGQKHNGPPWMSCSQSLFLVRHSFIPQFVSSYLALGGERDKTNLGEDKFVKLETKFGHSKIRRLSFGVDRCRPIPFGAKTFYAQQFTQQELDQLKNKGLI